MPSTPVGPSNPNANADAWKKFDRQVEVKTTEKGTREVDHAASVVPNLKDAGKGLGDIFTPDHFEAAENKKDGTWRDNVRTGVAAVREVADVITEPAKAIKNVADAGTHGVIAIAHGVRDIFG